MYTIVYNTNLYSINEHSSIRLCKSIKKTEIIHIELMEGCQNLQLKKY